MKLIQLIGFLFFSAFATACIACDVCGCSMGGSYIGILPQFHKNFIGLNYSERNFTTAHPILGQASSTVSKEHFSTTELRARINLSNRIQTFIFIPYTVNSQTENGLHSTLSGIGDARIIFNYNVLNTGDSMMNKWKHNLQAGVGIKLPTGSFNTLDRTQTVNPNLQAGTGSYDALMNIIYTIRHKKMGLNTNLIYQVNRANSSSYKFGNRLSVSSVVFYWTNIKGFSLLPHAGISFEQAATDFHKGMRIGASGGESSFTSAGVDFYIKDFTLGTVVQLPIYQNNEFVKNKFRSNVSILYNF